MSDQSHLSSFLEGNCAFADKAMLELMQAPEYVKNSIVEQHILNAIRRRELISAMSDFVKLVQPEQRQGVLHQISWIIRPKDDPIYAAQVLVAVIEKAERYGIEVTKGSLWLKHLRQLHAYLDLIGSNFEYEARYVLKRYPEQ